MRRPWSVTFLTLVVLSFTAIFIIRFVQAIRQWDLLVSLPLSISPIYLVLTGFFWGAAGLVLSWGIWRGHRWAAQLLKVTTLLFAAYYWLDRFWLMDDASGQEFWPFRLSLTAILLGLVFWAVSRPRARAFFGEMNDRESENSTAA